MAILFLFSNYSRNAEKESSVIQNFGINQEESHQQTIDQGIVHPSPSDSRSVRTIYF